MPTHDLTLQAFDITELSPYHRNPRRGDVAAIARSLEINGQYRPIVVNLGAHTGRPLEVLAGNHTLAAAKSLGWSTITATTVDVDDVAAARIVAADNRTADLGGYDTDELLALLQDLPDLDGTGYDDSYLDELTALSDRKSWDVWDDRPANELPTDPQAQRGQRWQLGPHTLVCGDSRDPNCWTGVTGHVLLTDPPYGIGYTGGTTQRTEIEGDATGGEAAALLGEVLDTIPLEAGG